MCCQSIFKYERRGVVEQFTQSERENYLIGMIKVGFLKRLRAGQFFCHHFEADD